MTNKLVLNFPYKKDSIKTVSTAYSKASTNSIYSNLKTWGWGHFQIIVEINEKVE